LAKPHYIGDDNKVYALIVPGAAPTPTPTATQTATATPNTNCSADAHTGLKSNSTRLARPFTSGNAANVTRDLNFNGTIVGNVHAQPLYIEGGPNGPMIIAVTASNNVYALDATDGSIVWEGMLGRR
jgi:outer membrane protein assembly factor BamB